VKISVPDLIPAASELGRVHFVGIGGAGLSAIARIMAQQRVPVPEVVPAASELGRVHFVGIGGAGLSAIARIMARQGVPGTGSDDQDTPFLPALRELGVPIQLSYDAGHVGDADTLVVTTAAADDNPELLAGRERGLRILPRSAGLKATMAGHDVVAVAGTHGKTTTTSMLTMALLAAGADPTYAIGGVLAATGRNADLGSGQLFVAEADESDGAFLVYSPHAALVTNVEADHLDNYGTEEAYREAFDVFVERIEPDGFLVACVDDPGAARLVERARSLDVDTVAVGTDPSADVRVEDVVPTGAGSRFSVVDRGRRLGEVVLQVPGHHYVLDAAAALACGLRLGFGFEELARGLGSFTGTRRRMELKGEAAGVRVYDSYAHHPREIAGDLQAARALAGEGRVVVAFQPHMVSRTRIFGAEMGTELGAADEVVVMDIYLARENPEPGVSSRLVSDAVPLPGDRVLLEPSWSAVPERLVERARPGDLVLTLGAGDVTLLGPEVLDRLREREAGTTEDRT
jgi:UDP-N-acetylmuramate--alanine ligase